MKITYNFGQKFELKEIDMWSQYLVFETNDGMNLFKENFYTEEDNDKIIFKVPFEHIKELDNIPFLLWDFLEQNRLIYIED